MVCSRELSEREFHNFIREKDFCKTKCSKNVHIISKLIASYRINRDNFISYCIKTSKIKNWWEGFYVIMNFR